MRATWREISAITMPQASGSSKARRSEICKAPSTMTARNTSTPPDSKTTGGTCSASNTGAESPGVESPGFISCSPVADRLCSLDHLRHRRQRKFLQIGGVRHWHVLGGHTHDRCIKPIERLLHQTCSDLGTDARLPPPLLHRDGTARLFHRLDDRAKVHWPERPHVDDLCADPGTREFVSGLQGIAHPHGPRDYCHILARSRDFCLADGYEVVVKFWHRKTLAVKHFVLEKNNRVGIANCRFQQPFGISGRMRCDNFEAGDVRIQGSKVLAVLGGNARRRPIRSAKNYAEADLATRHVARLRGGIDQMIHRLHGEVEGHELDDRFQSGECCSDTQAGEAMF